MEVFSKKRLMRIFLRKSEDSLRRSSALTCIIYNFAAFCRFFVQNTNKISTQALYAGVGE